MSIPSTAILSIPWRIWRPGPLKKPGIKRRQTRPNKKCRKERTDKKELSEKELQERTVKKN
jgi:hypothetical protein